MKSATILYVDDDPLNLMLFEAMFKKKYEVITAESGSKGLDILGKRSDINVIISDMKMPEMNGIEFVERANSFFPDPLYYILTGFEITPEIKEAIRTGLLCEYFQKPFNMKVIDHSISKNLGLSFT